MIFKNNKINLNTEINNQGNIQEICIEKSIIHEILQTLMTNTIYLHNQVVIT